MAKLKTERGAYRRRIENLDHWTSPSSKMTQVQITHKGKDYRVLFFAEALISISTRNGAHVGIDTKLGQGLFEMAKARVAT